MLHTIFGQEQHEICVELNINRMIWIGNSSSAGVFPSV